MMTVEFATLRRQRRCVDCSVDCRDNVGRCRRLLNADENETCEIWKERITVDKIVVGLVLLDDLPVYRHPIFLIILLTLLSTAFAISYLRIGNFTSFFWLLFLARRYVMSIFSNSGGVSKFLERRFAQFGNRPSEYKRSVVAHIWQIRQQSFCCAQLTRS